MIDLTGKYILVTGATGGIGQGISKLLHSLGAFIYLSGSNAEKLAILKNELSDKCATIPCDLSDLDACADMIKSIEKLDGLVCNAGITLDKISIAMKNEDFSKVIDINLTASFVLNREALKKMSRARYGRIVNISSVVATMGNPGQANYCASKAGLIGMSKALAKEVAARNVTVNIVSPGFIESPMTAKLNEEQVSYIKNSIPSGKMGTAEDIASAVAFLLSDHASYINGQTIHVNGGMIMP